MITHLRLTWRLQRWEILFVAALCLGFAGVAIWQAVDMRSALTGCGTPSAAEACRLTYPFQESHGNTVSIVEMGGSLVPYLAGLVLGAPLIAREVEHRTGLIAWPLSGSRVKWLLWRLGPILLVDVVLVAILAVAVDQMLRAYMPNSNLGFVQYEQRGVPAVAHSVVILLAAVTIGGAMGRVLPALLVGIGAALAVSAALAWALPHWVPSTELGVGPNWPGEGPLMTGVHYRAPDGRVLDEQTAQALLEAAYEANPGIEPDPSTLPQPIFIGIAANRYGDVVLRESAVQGAAAIGLGALGAFVVGRRRPE